MHYLPETTIRYTVDNLGLARDPGDVNAGDLGRVLGPMNDTPEWYLTEPAKYPGKVCPVHTSMFERAA